MILVDSTVWIDFLNGRGLPHVQRLRSLLGIEEIAIGDLMLFEVLQGLSTEQDAAQVEAHLRRFEVVSLLNDTIAVKAAQNYRALRKRGVTVRKTIDVLIGTWCIEHRMPLLHNDRDFQPMVRYLGLSEVPIE